MTRWILLLRGINVGGAGKLPMTDLRRIIADAGGEDVQTYIQSGNAVFRSTVPEGQLDQAIANGIEASAGFRPALFLLTDTQLRKAVDANPWPEARDDPKPMHLFFHDGAATPDAEKLDALLAKDEAWHHTPQVLYLRAPSGVGRSKFAEKLPRLFRAQMTARNLKTCDKLLDMAAALDA